MSVAELYRNRGVNPLAVQGGLMRLPLDANTIGLWWFDDRNGSLLKDRAATPHNGSIVGPTWNGLGPWGSGLTFDASAEHIEGSSQLIGGLANFTIEVIAETSQSTGQQVLYGERLNTTSNQSWFSLNDNAGTLIVRLTMANAARSNYYVVSGTGAVSLNHPHYCAVVVSGTSNATIYLDGSAGGTSTSFGATYSGNNGWGMGAEVYTTWAYSCLVGKMYLVRVSNVARSAAEILTNAKLMGFA